MKKFLKILTPIILILITSQSFATDLTYYADESKEVKVYFSMQYIQPANYRLIDHITIKNLSTKRAYKLACKLTVTTADEYSWNDGIEIVLYNDAGPYYSSIMSSSYSREIEFHNLKADKNKQIKFSIESYAHSGNLQEGDCILSY